MKNAIRLALPLLAATGLSAAEPTRIAFTNGGMERGTDQPVGWTQSWVGRGALTITRDTSVSRHGKASLRVATTGDAKGNAFQMIDVPGGIAIAVRGAVRTEGKVKASVFAQSFTADWKPIGFQQLAYRHDNAPSDWSDFTGTATLPGNAARVGIGILVEGDGTAWIDDLRDAQDPDPAATADAAEPDSAPDITEGPPAKDKPSVPGWGFYPRFPTAWKARHEQNLARTRQGGIDVVFFGDSLTQGWGDGGKEPWETHFKPLKAVNYGIGGDSTRQVLWRIANGEVDGLTPRAVVVCIGTNNLYSDWNAGNEAEIADGIAAVATALRAKLPTTRVLVLGLLPRQNAWFCERIDRINAAVAKLDDGKDVRVLDMGGRFLKGPGAVRPELFIGDQLHLAKPGYVLWAEGIAPLLDEMIRQP